MFTSLLKNRQELGRMVKHCLDFSFVFSAPLPAWENLFSASGIFCGGRYHQPGCTGIFWPAEGTNQPITISKKWKNLSSALCRKSTWVQAPPWFSTSTWGVGILASATDLKSQKGLYSSLLLYIKFTSIYVILRWGQELVLIFSHLYSKGPDINFQQEWCDWHINSIIYSNWDLYFSKTMINLWLHKIDSIGIKLNAIC